MREYSRRGSGGGARSAPAAVGWPADDDILRPGVRRFFRVIAFDEYTRCGSGSVVGLTRIWHRPAADRACRLPALRQGS